MGVGKGKCTVRTHYRPVYYNVKYVTGLDSGRGGAEVWTLGPVDREEHRQLAAEVVVADAGRIATTHPITIIIDDVNDNPMRPATKTVYLWKTQVTYQFCFEYFTNYIMFSVSYLFFLPHLASFLAYVDHLCETSKAFPQKQLITFK